MIELIYNEEENEITEEAMLPEPKNVKQIGEPKEFKKIFIEDYVHTFLTQYSTVQEQDTKIAILLGHSERRGGKRHLFIKGALPVENVTERKGKYQFTEKIWGTIYQESEKYFPKEEILGWFLSRAGLATEKNPVTEETHRTYFSGADKLLFMIEPMECESVFWGFDGNRFARQSGYYIYYEKNEAMREFMLDKKSMQEKEQKNESPDIAMANFRRILQEKQQKNEKRKKNAVFFGTRAAAVLLLFAGAVLFWRQEDQIERMEQQLGAVSEQETVRETVSSEVVIEELPGEVDAVPEEIHEQSATEEEKPQELPVTEENATEEKATEEVPAEESVQEETSAPVYEEYTVQAGDTLAGISRSIYGTDHRVSEICQLNGISNGDYIQVGEIILLPSK